MLILSHQRKSISKDNFKKRNMEIVGLKTITKMKNYKGNSKFDLTEYQ